jgi:signal peptidase II
VRLQRVSLAVVLLDQATKQWVLHHFKLGESVTLIPGYLYFTYIQNPGAAFGFMATTGVFWRIPFFLAISLGAGLVVYAYQRHLSPSEKAARFALGLIWGGALGNFIDRIFYRQVVDFIEVRFAGHQWFPYIFNLADSCITIGVIILVLAHWFGDKKEIKGEA